MTLVVDNNEDAMNMNLEMDYNNKSQEVTDYRCDQCGKFFAAARSLALHKKIHSGIKPYVCPHEGCGKAFYVRAQLTRHSYTHSNIRTEKCPFKNCTSPIKLFKTKADVRQHVKNWHTLEKSEQREQKLLKKVEKWKKFAETYKKLRDHNRELEEENKRLKAQLELQAHTTQPLLSLEKSLQTGDETSELKLKRPVPAYTQFLREQYHHMKDQGEKMTFTECSKQISKMWHDLPEEEKKTYTDRFHREMDAFNKNRLPSKDIGNDALLTEPSLAQQPSFVNIDTSLNEVFICRKCGSNDIYHSYSSNPVYSYSYSHRDMPESLPLIPDTI